MAEFMTETTRCPAGAQPAVGGPPPHAAAPAEPFPRQPADRAADGPGGAADGHDAAVILEGARAEVDPELRAAVASLPDSMRRIARYHFGWEQADGTPTAGPAGKAIRPALVLAAATALGGAPARADAARAAAAVELVHNFTLLHDDVMDRDTTRRHRPTAWTVFGDADAILAGDALQALALRLLAEDRHPASPAAAARLAACVVELCAGQHADTALERRDPRDVTLTEVLAMAEAKTGALLGCACAVGALYAGAGEEEVEALDAFGRQAGLAFQLIDDVIGIWGDPARTGKPCGADLAARKKSLPVVAALTSGTPEATELAEIYARPHREGEEESTALVVERAGGRDWAQSEAADRMARAVHDLARAVPDPAAAGGLPALAEFVTRRTS
ncbi:family 2 encapsulin nanocompartment cargo protein polyprenyl transferase [Streptomyces mexicanus]|uniref:family 2 encapsulin nanocompartment cargo protein polyprenyl transferase n=1 Tax=Streptomyces mexicanus TaxID=178566 RepID=UPI0013588A24|nr:family 2 encapsulin nanocompartment cargo protein polyprenyl transferase [Streptomyces mexicanus]